MTGYTYNSNNELLQSSASACIGTACSSALTSFAYDANGLLGSENTTSDQWTYAWDVPGRLLKATDNGATRGAYAYDGNGRRVESVETATTFYAYTGTETLMEMVPGVVVNDYVYAAGLRIAKISGTTISYYHEDALGSTRLVTDSSKRLLFSDNYQPFGQDQSTGAETYRFTGKPVSAKRIVAGS